MSNNNWCVNAFKFIENLADNALVHIFRHFNDGGILKKTFILNIKYFQKIFLSLVNFFQIYVHINYYYWYYRNIESKLIMSVYLLIYIHI